MSFSFIKPELKPIISLFSKIWIILIAFVFVVLFILNLFIIYKNYALSSSSQEINQNQINLRNEIISIDNITQKLKEQTNTAIDIYTSNIILKQSLHNLFDLVPNSITLHEVIMNKNSLIIKGITPNKDVFNQLLGSPLKSIFTTSNTSFYQIKNGWFGFISTNKIDNSEGYNE